MARTSAPKRPKVVDFVPAAQVDVRIESIRPAIAELERYIQWVHQKYGGGRSADLPAVTVMVQTRGVKKKLCGHFRADIISTREGDVGHEISLTSEQLMRPVMEILETAHHEAVHLWNHDNLVRPDVSKGGRHNKEFAETAKTFGLTVEANGSSGMSLTRMTPETAQAVEKEFIPDYTAFKLFRLIPPPVAAKPNKRQAWTCGCQNVMMAMKQEFKATCDECNNPFEKTDGVKEKDGV